MKKNLTSIAVVLIIALTIVGCKKTSDVPANKNELTPAEVAMIQAAGFSSTGATILNGAYLIEGDILLTAAELGSLSKETETHLIVANAEHYHTTKLVKYLPRTINLRYTGNYPSFQTALVTAMNRFNELNLSIKFKIDPAHHAEIKVHDVTGGPIAWSGTPTAGNPYDTIEVNTNIAGWNAKALATLLAHHLGHCIGFRHTDYRDFHGCFGAFEAVGFVGAIYIPGTPPGADADSWMLACIDNGTNRNFNPNDLIALRYLY